MTPTEWELACDRLDAVVATVVRLNPDKASQAKAKPALAGWFVGRVMRITDAQMPRGMVSESVKYHLGID